MTMDESSLRESSTSNEQQHVTIGSTNDLDSVENEIETSFPTNKKVKPKKVPRALLELSDFNSHGFTSALLETHKRKRPRQSPDCFGFSNSLRPVPSNYSRLLSATNSDIRQLLRASTVKKRRLEKLWYWELPSKIVSEQKGTNAPSTTTKPRIVDEAKKKERPLKILKKRNLKTLSVLRSLYKPRRSMESNIVKSNCENQKGSAAPSITGTPAGVTVSVGIPTHKREKCDMNHRAVTGRPTKQLTSSTKGICDTEWENDFGMNMDMHMEMDMVSTSVALHPVHAKNEKEEVPKQLTKEEKLTKYKNMDPMSCMQKQAYDTEWENDFGKNMDSTSVTLHPVHAKNEKEVLPKKLTKEEKLTKYKNMDPMSCMQKQAYDTEWENDFGINMDSTSVALHPVHAKNEKEVFPKKLTKEQKLTKYKNIDPMSCLQKQAYDTEWEKDFGINTDSTSVTLHPVHAKNEKEEALPKRLTKEEELTKCKNVDPMSCMKKKANDTEWEHDFAIDIVSISAALDPAHIAIPCIKKKYLWQAVFDTFLKQKQIIVKNETEMKVNREGDKRNDPLLSTLIAPNMTFSNALVSIDFVNLAQQAQTH